MSSMKRNRNPTLPYPAARMLLILEVREMTFKSAIFANRARIWISA